jgi:hypothetical protein
VARRGTKALEQVQLDPGAPDSRARASEVLAEIEARAKPRRADLETIARHARLFASIGLGERARAVLKRGRAAGIRSDAIDVADAVIAVTLDPAQASARLRAMATKDPETAAYEVVLAVVRGDLRGAIALAERHHGFVEVAGATDALAYVLLAYVLSDRFADADVLLARWRAQHPRPEPALEVALLRAEALVAAYANRHAEEVARLEDALALCEEHGLGEAALFAGIALAVAHARTGEIERARRWADALPPAPDVPQSTIDAYRDLARLEIAILDDRAADADVLARRVVPFAERAGNVVLLLLARFAAVLSAGEASFGPALASYARLVHQHPIPYHQRRLRLVESRVAAGARSLRTARLIERTRHGETHVPLARAWNPSASALAADLYLDRVHETLRLRGGPTVAVADRPVLGRALGVLADAPGFALPLASFYEQVWESRWDPLRHETKCHVTLHRLRAWLIELGAPDDRWIELTDGVVRLSPSLDVGVLSA